MTVRPFKAKTIDFERYDYRVVLLQAPLGGPGITPCEAINACQRAGAVAAGLSDFAHQDATAREGLKDGQSVP